jgi:hypothetical protein
MNPLSRHVRGSAFEFNCYFPVDGALITTRAAARKATAHHTKTTDKPKNDK